MWILVVVWLTCGLFGVLVTGYRRPHRIFRGGFDVLAGVIGGVLLGAISLYSALTNPNDEL
ncbi:MAG: hypothetical protein ACREF9_14125 [Opitutaceae bacterium]